MAVSVALVAALMSTCLISLAPNVLLFIFPSYGQGEGTHSHFLSLGQAMAAGGLLGDVFLHTLPHAESMEDAGLWVIAGFTLFLVADMLIRSADSSHSHSHGGHSHEHAEKNDSKDKKEGNPPAEEFRISPKILLNLAGDAMHNFTDGLAIGASFSIQSSLIQNDASLVTLLSSRGGLATISILLHELPHELGDFSTLVRAGCSKKQAIALQFTTAIAALIGTVMGVFAVEGHGGEHLLFITGGGFIYLAAVTILPEVLNDATSLRFRFAQLACFLCGVAFLYLVAVIEHASGGHGGHSHSHSHHDHHTEHKVDHHEQHDHDHGHNDRHLDEHHHGHEHHGEL